MKLSDVDLAQIEKAKDLLTLRGRDCGCRLGVVKRLGARDLLLSPSRVFLPSADGRLTAKRQAFVEDLGDPEGPIELACLHHSTLLDLPAVRARVAAAASSRSSVLVLP